MKKLLAVGVLAVCAAGCVMPQSPLGAPISIDVQGPMSYVDNSVKPLKMGTATAKGIILYSDGDASIAAAMKEGTNSVVFEKFVCMYPEGIGAKSVWPEDDDRFESLQQKYARQALFADFLSEHHAKPIEVNDYLSSIESSPLTQRTKFANLLLRPQVELNQLKSCCPNIQDFIINNNIIIRDNKKFFHVQLYFCSPKTHKFLFFISFS